ncbi:MAG: tagaturonate epimerase family protein [Sphaerochaeta sp.]
MELYEEKRIKPEQLKKRLGKPITLYERSATSLGECTLALVRAGREKYLVATGSGPVFDELEGTTEGSCKICPTNHANRLVLNSYLPYTKPQSNANKRTSIGLGDRLGEATCGHIRALQGTSVFPLFAQQSVRELTLTGRTFEDVIDKAAYAVFQEGYTGGYGADGDHLKKEADIEKALEAGVTMITLDSSDVIDNTVFTLGTHEVEAKYEQLDATLCKSYEDRYRDQVFTVSDQSYTLDAEHLKRDILIYHRALDFIQAIYEKYIAGSAVSLDFEVSIDETDTPTDAKSHLFIALELKRRKVVVSTLAPRFIGEFQKGIDYRGDLALFEQDLLAHTAIAKQFGYRLSVHSGSDKFSIFPILQKTIKGSFHIKTAGTNWLEAMRLVALKDPDLYRRMHRHALSRFADARAFYHVTTDISAIEALDATQDAELVHYLEDDNARQLLHITYGFLLEDTDATGRKLFKDEFFSLLAIEEQLYADLLAKHIGKHLHLLGFAS